MDRNRHGVPLYRAYPPTAAAQKPTPLPRQTCTWRACSRTAQEHMPVCATHARAIAEMEHRKRHTDCPADRLRQELVNLQATAAHYYTLLNPPPVKRETTPRQVDEEGWIYYIRVDGHYKIGYAKNVRSRMQAYPPTSVLLSLHKGTRKDETAIHAKLADHRVAGREWYKPSPEVQAYIESVVTIHGRCKDMFLERTAPKPRKPTSPVRLRSRTLKKR